GAPGGAFHARRQDHADLRRNEPDPAGRDREAVARRLTDVAPQRGYARSGDAYLGYTVTGAAGVDLLYVANNTIATDCFDEEPHAVHFFERLASFSRLIRYDVRGVGISDRLDPATPPTIDRATQDAVAVMDAVGSERAFVVGEAGGGLVAMELAA